MSGRPPFDALNTPSRGAVDRILSAADQTAANAAALAEIRELCTTIHRHAVIPSRRIRQILKKHGL